MRRQQSTMNQLYQFSLRSTETYEGELNPYILGILKWENSEFITPPTLRYFKTPPRSAFPMILERQDYNYRQTSRQIQNKLAVFLSKESVKNELEMKQTKKFSIFTYRGVLRKILIGAYFDSRWCIFATRVGSKIYIIDKYQPHNETNPSRMQHWRFVQNCFADSANGTPDTSVPFMEDDQFYSLFHTQIGDMDLIYTGEITGVLAKNDVKNLQDVKELNKLNFVLTKTVKKGQNKRKWDKLCRTTWAQCYLGKITDIYVGIKEREGENGPMMVQEDILHFEVDELCGRSGFTKNRQLGQLHGFLKALEAKMARVDCPYTTYELKYDPRTKHVTYTVHEGRTEHTFLSPELIECSTN